MAVYQMPGGRHSQPLRRGTPKDQDASRHNARHRVEEARCSWLRQQDGTFRDEKRFDDAIDEAVQPLRILHCHRIGGQGQRIGIGYLQAHCSSRAAEINAIRTLAATGDEDLIMNRRQCRRRH